MADKPSLLRFAWWNTGIAPPWVRSTASTDQRKTVGRVIERLLVKDDCALMGLGEVRRESLLALVPTQLHSRWAELCDPSSDRNDFDIGLLYDRTRFTLVDAIWVKARWVGSEVRAGLVATLRSTDSFSSAHFIVALAHWRADMGDVVDAAARRSCAAQALRRAISTCIDSTSPATPHVLALGDFNSEPFNEEFRTDLPTSRYRDVVRDHSRRVGTDDLLLYNPSWRLLGERRPWTGARARSFAGTFKMGDLPSAWRTFDQVLVSGSLLGMSQWVLRADELRIWTEDVVLEPEDPKFFSSSIDHLPVVGLLQWIDDAPAQGTVQP